MAVSTTETEDPFVEAQLQQLLLEAGLESAPFDPASFEALKRHIQKSTEAGKPLFPPSSKLQSTQEEGEEKTEDPPLHNVDIYGPTSSSDESPQKKDAANTTAGNPSTPVVNIKDLAPLQQRQALFSPTTSEITDPGSSVRYNHPKGNNVNAASNISAISGTSLTTRSDARILEQLQVQTSLILQLQRRVDELTNIVHNQQEQLYNVDAAVNGGGVNPNNLQRPQLQPQRTMSELTQQSYGVSPLSNQYGDSRMGDATTSTASSDVASNAAVAPAATRGLPVPPPPPPQANQPPAAAGAAPPPPLVVPPAAVVVERGALWRFLTSPWATIRNTRIAKLFEVYLKARKLEVQDLQWGALLKILVMMTILLGRIMSSSTSSRRYRQQEDGSSSFYSNIPAKFYVLIGVVVLGFLAQTGYLQFVYKFCFKDRYPHRILVDGEDPNEILQELEDLARPDPQRRQRQQQQQQGEGQGNENENANGNDGGGNNNNNGGGGLDWDGTFLLGGRIERGAGAPQPQEDGQPPLQEPPQPQQPMVRALNLLWSGVMDIVYLLGSFVLSIFPMWRPQAAREPHRVGQPAAAAAEANNAEGNNGNNNNEGPGQVRPPQDPAAANDDEEGDY